MDVLLNHQKEIEKNKKRKEVDSNAEFIDDIKAYRNYRTELEIWKPSRRAVIAQIYQQINNIVEKVLVD